MFLQGYLDPEYYTTQQLSDKSDVYSFGIVMLELVTARPPIKDGKFIVRLVKAALEKGGISGLQGEVMDPFLRKSSETETLTGFERFLGLALSCVEESGFERPSMREVVKELELIMEMGSGFSADSIPARRNSFVKKGQPPLPYYGQDMEAGNSSGDVLSNRDVFEYSGGYPISSTVRPM